MQIEHYLSIEMRVVCCMYQKRFIIICLSLIVGITNERHSSTSASFAFVNSAHSFHGVKKAHFASAWSVT